MSSAAKDSTEVVKFLSLFSRVRDWCDDGPHNLARMSKEDEGARRLLVKLFWAAEAIRFGERRRRELFAAPVDPQFIAAWRDYERRYHTPVSNCAFSELLELEEILSGEDDGGKNTASPAEAHWEAENDEATDQAAAIQAAIDFANEQASQDRWFGNESYIDQVLDGVRKWEGLASDIGIDLIGVLRRRALVPFVLVPRHVANRHGARHAPSLLENLHRAHQAFIFGAPFAALAMMRSIVETALRDHYNISALDMNELIKRSSSRLPPDVSNNALHRLRRLANAVLHVDHSEIEISKRNEAQLEQSIAALLLVTRNLIEGAPAR